MKACKVIAVVVMCCALVAGVPSGAKGALVDWTGAVDTNFNTGGNWGGGSFPAVADQARIRNGGTADLGATPPNSTSELWVGDDGGAGNLTMSAGTLTVDNWMVAGRRNNTPLSTFTMTGGTVNSRRTLLGSDGSGAHGEFRLSGNAVFNNSEYMSIGTANGSFGTLRMQDTAQLLVSGDLNVSDQGGSTGELYVDGGLARGNVVFIGKSGGTVGKVFQTGGEVRSNNYFNIGTAGGSTGEYHLDNGTAWASSDLNVSDQANSTGMLYLNGGLARGNNVYVGKSGGTSGTVVQNGGEMRADGDLYIGKSGSSTGNYTLANGQINVNGGVLRVGDQGAGTLTQTGGAVTTQNWFVVAQDIGSVGQYNITGGTLDVNANGGGEWFEIAVWQDANGTASVGGTGVVTVHDTGLRMAGQANTVAELNVAGNGLVETPRLYVGMAGTATVNQTGGTVHVANGGDETRIGEGGTSTGTYNLGGGLLNVSGNLQTGWNGTGTLDVSGTGQVDVAGWFVAGRQATGTGTITVRGSGVANANGGALIIGEQGVGTVNVEDSATVNANQIRVGFVNDGTLNQSGGYVKAPDTVVAMNAGSVGKLNLSGGVLETVNLRYGDGTPTVNWTGGTLKPGTVQFSLSNPAGRLEVAQQGFTSRWYDGNAMTDAPDAWDFHTSPSVFAETVDSVNWGGGWPAGVGGDYDGAVFSGKLYVPAAGNYSFRERVDDSSALYVDGVKVLWDYTNGSDLGEAAGDPWTVHSSTTVALGQGWHQVDFRYSDHYGGQDAYLEWDPAGGSNWSLLDLAGLGTDVGVTMVKGDYTQGAAGVLALDILAAPYGFDELWVEGQADLAGILEVTLGPDVAIGDTFTVLYADQLDGQFGEVRSNGFPFADGYWRTWYDYDAGTVTLETAVPEPVTMLSLLAASAGVCGYLRRRRK